VINMTRNRARRVRRGLMVLALAALSHFGSAVAEPSGLALVIGVDRDAGLAGEGVCGPAARGVRDRLGAQGLAVQAVLNPSEVTLRSAIDGFAAQVERNPSGTAPGIALVYVCGKAALAEDRLFLMPSVAGSDSRADPARQGVVLQALFNALAGSGGTLYADLGLTAPAAAGGAVEEAGKRLPSGLHLALSLTERDGAARLGERLVSADFRAGQGWDAMAAALQAGGPADGTVLLPPPADPKASASPAPDAPPSTATAQAAPPGDPAQPSGADGDAPAGPDPAGSQPNAPPQPPARARSAEAPGNGRIKRLQAALARTGYAGPLDGRLNGPTLAAIRAFQRSLGNPETGVLSQTELVHLLNR